MRPFLCLLALLAALLPVPAAGQVTPTAATVLRVIDGDTVDVVTAEGKRERVRLIGIDTPETTDPPVLCFGMEARQRARELLPEGAAVAVELDASQGERDRFGRALAHLILDTPAGPVNVGHALIADGYAREYTHRSPHARQAEFKEAAAVARDQGRGLWAACGGQIYPSDLDGPLRGLLSGVQDGAGPIVASQGITRACPDFPSRALAFLRSDLRDPTRIDADREKVACESSWAPRDVAGR